MEMSTTVSALSKALATAQASISGASKDAKNPAFKRDGKDLKYATLMSVWEAWQEVGPAQGLAIIQMPGAMVDNQVTLTTMLAHESGEWMRETLTIPVTKGDAQGYGSALTYARRYALAAFVGVAPEDDDGNAAVEPAARKEPAPHKPPAPKRDWQAWALDFMAQIASTKTPAELAKLRDDSAADRAALKAFDANISEGVNTAYKQRASELTPAKQKEDA